jgi:hypothetical protein
VDRVGWCLGFVAHPNKKTAFIDLHGVLTGFDAARMGYDPIYENPLDPFKRPVVYPRLWIIFAQLGLSAKNTKFVALFLLLAYATSLFIGVKGYDRKTAIWMLVIVISPASMTCYERANLELIIFILLSLGLGLSQYSKYWMFGLVEVAAFLKYFPITGLGYFLKEPRKSFFKFLFFGIGIFAIYILLTWEDTVWIFGHAPKGALEHYGVGVVGVRIYEITDSRHYSNLTFISFYVLSYILMMLILYKSYKFKTNLSKIDNPFLDAFRVGALIYLGTFLQGNSYNYRFISLIFSVPQLIYWVSHTPGMRQFVTWTFIALVISSWSAFLFQFLPVNLEFILDEIANWVLFAGLLFLFLVSSPSWLREEISSFFGRYRARLLSNDSGDIIA